MGNQGTRYAREFRKEAVKQVVDRGYSVREVAQRLGIASSSLHRWVSGGRASAKSDADELGERDLATEVARLKKELRRVLNVHRSGFYAWMKQPRSARKIENQRLIEEIRHYWEESDRAYGSPRIHQDLLEAGIRCGVNRVARLMGEHGIHAYLATKKRGFRGAGKSAEGRQSRMAPNILSQQFGVEQLNTMWATDITHIPTLEGWLYVAVVMDLCSRRIVGWSMQTTMHRDLVIQALLSARWRRMPTNTVIIHSDQGSQYASNDWSAFCRDNGFTPSMSRRGNCYDNAAMESFFASMKKERTRRCRYRTREEARSAIFDYVEVFYNRKRRHEYLGQQSPVDYEAALKER